MQTHAVLLHEPRRLEIAELALTPPVAGDCVVDIQSSGISTGTEKLLWSGAMPAFPGMGYPLVPGYESVGVVVEAKACSARSVGDFVFVPGAKCFGDVRGLFGGSARRVVVAEDRIIPIDAGLGANGALLALAATAQHAIGSHTKPDLIIGHGVLGRLLARLTTAAAKVDGTAAPVVWELDVARRQGADGYTCIHPDSDDRRDYRAIYDVSGDASLLDTLIARLAPQGEIVLAGFYAERPNFAFAPAFMKEARIRIAAEWKPDDLVAVRRTIDTGAVSLDGLITHTHAATSADQAYRTAFSDPTCLKMILDWSCLA